MDNISFGIIEEYNDPLKLGRYQVRDIYYHTEDKQLLPTDKLPWALVLHDVFNSKMQGIGKDGKLVKGTSVMLMYLDTGKQQPVILGTVGGIHTVKGDAAKGFVDPDGVYPDANKLNESDVNRLARNEKIEDTIVQLKKDSIDKDVEDAVGGKWSEPITPYAAVYPHNTVTQTEAGHVIETDDTPNAERIHLYHKSGTFVEVHPDGTTVTRRVKDNYEVVAGNTNVHVKGIYNITVDGDAHIKAKSAVLDCVKIQLGRDSKEPIVLGQQLLDAINNHLDKEFNNHIHPTGVGPSGKPIVPAVLFTDVILSKLGFIK